MVPTREHDSAAQGIHHVPESIPGWIIIECSARPEMGSETGFESRTVHNAKYGLKAVIKISLQQISPRSVLKSGVVYTIVVPPCTFFIRLRGPFPEYLSVELPPPRQV